MQQKKIEGSWSTFTEILGDLVMWLVFSPSAPVMSFCIAMSKALKLYWSILCLRCHDLFLNCIPP